MGISPDDTFTYWIPGELSKPESERRGLVYRHGTAGDWRRFVAERDRLQKLPVNEYIDGLIALAKRGLAGWVGIAAPFDGNIDDVLTQGDIIELVDELRYASGLAEVEKKRLSSPSPSGAASSAKGV